jgi:hypothetical protein
MVMVILKVRTYKTERVIIIAREHKTGKGVSEKRQEWKMFIKKGQLLFSNFRILLIAFHFCIVGEFRSFYSTLPMS